MTNITDEEVLRTQIRQLKEAVAVIENRNAGTTGIKPEEMWIFMRQRMDKDTPTHPRLIGIFNGHVELDQVKKTLKRLENDLNDLDSNPEEMYDPMEHEDEFGQDMSFTDEADDSENEESEEENPAMTRDKNQRPLSAYQNSKE